MWKATFTPRPSWSWHPPPSCAARSRARWWPSRAARRMTAPSAWPSRRRSRATMSGANRRKKTGTKRKNSRARTVSGSVGAAVGVDGIEITASAVLPVQIIQQGFQRDDTDHAQAQCRLHFLHGGLRAFAAFLPVEGDGHADRLRAGGPDDLYRLPDRGGGGDDVVHDQHLSLQRVADDDAALAVFLHFLAVEGVRHVAVADRHGRGTGQRHALVGGAVNHVEGDGAVGDGAGVEPPQPRQFMTRIEQSAVEKIRADPPGFEGEFAEAQRLALDGEIEKLALVVFHGRDSNRRVTAWKVGYDKNPCASSRSTSTASVPRPRRACSSGWRARTPTSCACRRSRRSRPI